LLGPALQDVLAALSRSVLRKDAVATSAHRKRSGGRQQSRGPSDDGHARQWAQLGKLLMRATTTRTPKSREHAKHTTPKHPTSPDPHERVEKGQPPLSNGRSNRVAWRGDRGARPRRLNQRV